MRLSIPKRIRKLAEEVVRRGLKIEPEAKRAKEAPKPVKVLGFVEWVRKNHPRFQWYTHNLKVAEVLQEVADGKKNRLMIFWPPRHGKTEMLSRLFTAYYLYRHPERWVGLTCYGADLAHELSSQAMENYVLGGGTVHPKHASRKLWKTLFGGGMWASGVGGPITGRGFHLGLIDDPLKSAETADSEVIRKKQKEWYQSTFYTRAEPGEAIVIIMTRWHEDDLAGWQLLQEKENFEAGDDGETENWHIINLQAIRDFDDATIWPGSCTTMDDWRLPDEPLCPERYPLARLKRLAKRVGPYFWSALFQQKPTAKGGSVFKRAWFKVIHKDQAPKMLRIGVGCDLAYTVKTSADYTVAFPLGIDADGRFYLFRPFHEQVDGVNGVNGIAVRCHEVGAERCCVESVAAQATYIGHLRKHHLMQSRVVVGVPADRDKEARANGWAPVAEAGLITLVADGTGWEQTFLAEAQGFPRAPHDDLVDAVGIAIAGMAATVSGAAVTGTSKALDESLKAMGTIPKQR